MILYHSSTKENYSKIIETQDFKIKKCFKYEKYIDNMIDQISLYNSPANLPGSYPGAFIQAPFMGHGIYAFEKKEEAEQYRSNSEVIKIKLKDDYFFLNLDDEDSMFEMNDMLKECEEKISEIIKDEEIKKNYLLLVGLIRSCLYEEFKNSQPAVGILLFWRKDLLGNDSPDLVRRTFTKFPYYLLTNKAKILSIT